MYREYVPTCVETLFGSTAPTKFKARAIIPESRTLNMEGGGCRCCTCQQNNPPIQNTPHAQEDYTMRGNDVQYKCIMNCPDCRKQTKKKEDIVAYNEEAADQRRFKGKPRNRRVDKTHYECCCSPQISYTEDEYYPEERPRMRHKAIKKKNYSSDPSRSTDSRDHSDTDRFCSVCHLWVSSDTKEKRNEYSSKRYEARKLVDKDDCPRGYKFVVESCRFCGNRRDGPSESDKREEPCKALQSIVQTKGICALGKQVEQCSRSEGFFTIKQLEENAVRSDEKERDSCDEIYEKFAAEMAAMERYAEAPKEEDLIIGHNSQDELLRSNKERSPNRKELRKAHSTSEINNTEKQHDNTDGVLEEYKEQLMTEMNNTLRDNTPQNTTLRDNAPQNPDFRSCNCEHARRDWKVEVQSKIEPDKNEIGLLKKKCDEALVQLELFKREIAESKKGKCHCNLETAMCVVEDCKNRCAQLEKQVLYLKRCIEICTRSTANREKNLETRQPERFVEKQRKYERPIQRNSRRRDEDPEVITTKVRVSRKPKSTCPPPRERNMGCQHIRCFPQDQVPDIASFKKCPGFPGTTSKR